MSKKLIDRIDETRELWSSELKVCRSDLDNPVRLQHAVSRLVVEFDYLLVEARAALKQIATLKQENEALQKFVDEAMVIALSFPGLQEKLRALTTEEPNADA